MLKNNKVERKIGSLFKIATLSNMITPIKSQTFSEMSHRPSISFNKPTTISLKPTQLHNCQIRDIYIIQLFKESF